MAAISISSLLAGMSPEHIRKLLGEDLTQAASWVRVMALDGVAQAQLSYGRMLLEGTGAAKDSESALKWFERGGAQGNLDALNMVGRCHDMGWGTAANPAVASEYYRRAADAGHAWAQYNLGHLYLNGRGVSRDHARAHGYYLRAAEQGHARAMNLVGRCREHGWGCAADSVEARRWYELSARGDYFRGQYNWGTLLLEEGRTAEAADWLEKAARTGSAEVRAAVLNVSALHAHCEAMRRLQERLLRDIPAAKPAEPE